MTYQVPIPPLQIWPMFFSTNNFSGDLPQQSTQKKSQNSKIITLEPWVLSFKNEQRVMTNTSYTRHRYEKYKILPCPVVSNTI